MDNLLKAVGAEEEQLGKLSGIKPSTKLVTNGDTYTIMVITPKGTNETSFKCGVEFDDMIMGKIPVKSTFTVEGNKITQLIKRNDKESFIIREYNGDDLVQTFTSSEYDGEAKVWFKA